jgi:hypothetical protein
LSPWHSFAFNQLYIILFKTIIKDRQLKGLYYTSNINDEDYYYYNANKASKSKVNKYAFNKYSEIKVNK